MYCTMTITFTLLLHILLTYQSNSFSISKQCSISKRIALQASPKDTVNDDFWAQQKALAANFAEESEKQERDLKK